MVAYFILLVTERPSFAGKQQVRVESENDIMFKLTVTKDK